jgi:diguanylate cyclase (GGDEF)-like protein
MLSAITTPWPLALGYLDLDGFKSINDKQGHNMGDQVLKGIASLLKERIRATDICARLGGDEFVILLPETDSSGAHSIFNELHKNLLVHAHKNSWPVGFSLGVALYNAPPSNPDEAILAADKLMYNVKRSGKNRIMYESY